jgi:hypothetical protein
MDYHLEIYYSDGTKIVSPILTNNNLNEVSKFISVVLNRKPDSASYSDFVTLGGDMFSTNSGSITFKIKDVDRIEVIKEIPKKDPGCMIM